jgi:DNA repair photolyase
MRNMANDETKLVWFIGHPAARIWSINPYKACGIGCIYCIAQSQGKAEPWFSPDSVVGELQRRLANVPSNQELFVGALVDAYPPEEETLGITRMVLAELSRQKRAFCVCTKSNLVLRDADILARHDGHCDVYVSLCSLDQSLVSRLEVNAPAVAERLQAVSALKEAGIDVNIDAAPWIPGASDIRALLDVLPAGVGVQVAPIDIRHIGPEATLGGRRFTQDQIHAAYEQHRREVGDDSRIRWKSPRP